jgi:hypothetical protein
MMWAMARSPIALLGLAGLRILHRMAALFAAAAAAAAFASGQEPPGLPGLPGHDHSLEMKDADLLFPQRPGTGAAANAILVKWSGEAVEERGDAVVLSRGSIEIGGLAWGRLELKADIIEYSPSNRFLCADGNVHLGHPDFALRCRRIEVGFGDSGAAPSARRTGGQAEPNGAGGDIVPSGEAWDVVFDLPPSWTLKSAHVSFVSYPGDSLGAVGRLVSGGRATRTTEFSFEDASVTPCPADGSSVLGGPGWIAKASRLDLKAGSYGPASDIRGYATLRNAVLCIKSVPVAWAPWLAYPAKIDRAPGLLFPTLGYSARLGAALGVSYFQPLGPAADATLSPTWYSEEGAMWGLETRWAPDETHGGSLNARYVRPKSTGEARYVASLREIWDTEKGWMVRADINQASDQMVDAEFGAVGSLPLGSPTYNSSLFIGKNFERTAFSLFASDQRTFFQQDDVFYRPSFPGSMRKIKAPEAQLRLYPVSFGRFYLDGSLRAGQLGYSLDLGGPVPKANYFWDRGDGQMRLQGRLGQLGPLRADMQLGGRFTHYGAVLTDSFFGLDPAEGGGGLPPDPIDSPDFDPFRVEGPMAQRWLGSGRLQISTPQFGRRFPNLKIAGYRGDLKHILEPMVAFTLNSKSGAAGAFPRFDEVDTRPGVGNSAAGERSLELGLRQHIMGRPGPGGTYADILRLGTAIRYYQAPIILSNGHVKKGWGSLATSIDVEPSSKLRLSFRRSSEMLDGTADTSASADVSVGRRSLFSLAFFSSAIDQLQVRSRGVRMGGGHSMLGDSLRLRFNANYDVERGLFSQSLVSLGYAGRCVECGVRYQHVALPLVSPLAKEDRVDFTLSLKDIGEIFSAEIGEAIADLFR